MQENTKFCMNCGAGQNGAETSAASETAERAKKIANDLVSDGITSIKRLFSQSPVTAISEAADSMSQIWLAFSVINVMLFAFVSCLNTSQIINHLIGSMAKSILGAFDSLVGGFMPDYTIPPLYSSFWGFVLLAVIMQVAEFAGVYLVLSIHKRKQNFLANIANIVTTAGLPITAGLIINLVVGLIYPPATLLIFVATIIVSMVFLYEGIRALMKSEVFPIWEFGVVVLILCIVSLITINIVLKSVMSQFNVGNLFSSFF